MSRGRSKSRKCGQRLAWGQKRLELAVGAGVNQAQTMKGHVGHGGFAQIRWVSESWWRVLGRGWADLYFRKHPLGTRMGSVLGGQLSAGAGAGGAEGS